MTALLHTANVSYLPAAIIAAEDYVMAKQIEVSGAELSDVLGYDPETGEFTWLIKASSRALEGSRAGVWQRMQNGKDYLAITYRGRKMSAAQVAWCLQTGQWPDRSVFFKDDDTKNLKWSNLKLADHKSERVIRSDGKVGYKMSSEQSRHYGLMRYYGLTMTEYSRMFAAQNGLCAICGKPETHKMPGRVPSHARDETRTRDMSVDHDHKTGAVRQLLCNACNHGLGAFGDNPDVLRAAADYLDKHKETSNVTPFERAS